MFCDHLGLALCIYCVPLCIPCQCTLFCDHFFLALRMDCVAEMDSMPEYSVFRSFGLGIAYGLCSRWRAERHCKPTQLTLINHLDEHTKCHPLGITWNVLWSWEWCEYRALWASYACTTARTSSRDRISAAGQFHHTVHNGMILEGLSHSTSNIHHHDDEYRCGAPAN